MLKLEHIVCQIANILEEFDSTCPKQLYRDGVYFKPGIGPFREVPLVKQIAKQLSDGGISGRSVVARTHQRPDMSLQLSGDVSDTKDWAFEFKIVRPYGNNGKVATNWSRRLLYPREGNESLMGDALKLRTLPGFHHKALIAICFQEDAPELELEPFLASFELITKDIIKVPLGERIEEKRIGLVHPVHQILRCIGWQLDESASYNA